MGLIPGSGRFSGEGNGNLVQYSCLEKPHGQRNLVGYSLKGHRAWTRLSIQVPHGKAWHSIHIVTIKSQCSSSQFLYSVTLKNPTSTNVLSDIFWGAECARHRVLLFRNSQFSRHWLESGGHTYRQITNMQVQWWLYEQSSSFFQSYLMFPLPHPQQETRNVAQRSSSSKGSERRRESEESGTKHL